jgi:hypothetical protein
MPYKVLGVILAYSGLECILEFVIIGQLDENLEGGGYCRKVLKDNSHSAGVYN